MLGNEHHHTRRSAFSLVELLVVIAIMGVLMGMLMGGVQKARQAAARVQCANNMRQIGLGLHGYCNATGEFPQSSHSTMKLDQTWIYTLAPFLGDVDKLRICPADPKAQQRLDNRGTSYNLNEYICVPGESAALSLDHISIHARTMVLFTISDERGTATTEDHAHTRNWFKKGHIGAWERILADIQPDRFGGARGAAAKNRTTGTANYLFADNHLEALPAATIKQWADAGSNFAVPPQ